MDELRGSCAVLTGGSRGIGAVIAGALAAEGVNLVLAAPDADPLEAVAIARQNPEMIAKVEQSTTDYLNQMAPLLDKLAQNDKDTAALDEISRDAGAARGRQDSTDLGPLIATYIFRMCAATFVVLGAIMGIQAWFLPTHEPSTAMLTLVGPLLGGMFGSLAAMICFSLRKTRE